MSADLAAIRERLSKATPGPWELAYMMGMESWPVVIADRYGPIPDVAEGGFANAADAELIAHAPTDLAELMAEVETLRQLICELTDSDPCQFDHNGGCQAHGYLSLQPGETCPMFDAQQVMASVEEAAIGSSLV